MFIVIIVVSITLFFLAMLYMTWLGSPIAADIIRGTQELASRPADLTMTLVIYIACAIAGSLAVLGLFSFLPNEERKMELRQYARDHLGMTDEQVDLVLPYSKSPECMEEEIRRIQGGLRLYNRSK